MSDTIFPTTVESKSTVPTPNWQSDGSLDSLSEWGPWATSALIALMAKVGADSSAVVTSQDNLLASIGVLANVVVDHADTSPVTVLAADATRDREVLILVTGTEAATTDPDIDIGETDTVNKFLEDVGAGAWEVGHAFTAVGTLTAAKALIATIATAGASGKLRVIVIQLPDRT